MNYWRWAGEVSAEHSIGSERTHFEHPWRREDRRRWTNGKWEVDSDTSALQACGALGRENNHRRHRHFHTWPSWSQVSIWDHPSRTCPFRRNCQKQHRPCWSLLRWRYMEGNIYTILLCLWICERCFLHSFVSYCSSSVEYSLFQVITVSKLVNYQKVLVFQFVLIFMILLFWYKHTPRPSGGICNLRI